MDIQVNCPNCKRGYDSKNGHSNIICSNCNTEFSVYARHGKVLSVLEVLRPKTNPDSNYEEQKFNPYFDIDDAVPRKPNKYERRALWFGIILLVVFLIRFPRPILLIVIGILVFLLWRSYYKK